MLKEGNRFIFAVVSGIIGAIVRDIYSLAIKFMGLTKFFIWEIGADIFVNGKEIHSFWGYVIGGLTDFFIGGFLGVGFAVVIEIFGPKHYMVKGMGVALMFWFFLFGFFMHMYAPVFNLAPKEAFGYFSSFVAHCLYGVAMSYAYIKLAKIKNSDWKR